MDSSIDQPTNQVGSLAELTNSYQLSRYRENLFEQIFCAELLQGCWRAGLPPLEIDRPFVDFVGYDLVATCDGICRHIQLKATRGQISVHRALAKKASGCVINLKPGVDETGQRITFTYRFCGGLPGEPLFLPNELKPAKKTFHVNDKSGEFIKAERQDHVILPPSRFRGPMTIVDLAHCLFTNFPKDSDAKAP